MLLDIPLLGHVHDLDFSKSSGVKAKHGGIYLGMDISEAAGHKAECPKSRANPFTVLQYLLGHFYALGLSSSSSQVKVRQASYVACRYHKPLNIEWNRQNFTTLIFQSHLRVKVSLLSIICGTLVSETDGHRKHGEWQVKFGTLVILLDVLLFGHFHDLAPF